MFPISLRLSGRKVVVVGGGAVGRRRASAAASINATVVVVDPMPRPADFREERVVWLAEAYLADHLAGASLVFASATPAVNARVVADARERGVWVCDASDPGRGDFTVPAVARRGGLTVAVDTGGAAPELARAVRDRLVAGIDDAVPTWIALLGELRPVIRASLPDAAVRRAVARELSDWRWLDRIRREGPEAVRAAMRQIVVAAADRKPEPPASV